MEQQRLSTMVKDMRFEGFLLVRMAEQRSSSNGSKYLDMTLCDKSGDLNAKMWDGTVNPPKVGSVVKVRATIQEYNGRLQMRVEKMRPRQEGDDAPLDALMPCAPEKPEAMFAEIQAAIDEMTWEDLKKLTREMVNAVREKLMYFPAAQRLHHAERSGLMHHTTSMLRVARAVLPLYPFLNGDLLCAGVIVHDLSKTVEMLSDEAGNVTDYSKEGLLLGHLVDGVAQVRLAAQRAGVEGECVTLLSHMVISHHGVPEFGSPRAPMFPEAEMLHMIDDMDAKMNEMEGVLRRTPAGAFSEKIWSLDRRLYHPLYPEKTEGTEGAAQTAGKTAAAGKPEAAPARSGQTEKPRYPRPDAQQAYEGLL